MLFEDDSADAMRGVELSGGRVDEDWAGAVKDDAAGAGEDDWEGTVGDNSAGAVKGEGVAVGAVGVGIRYVESIKRKLLYVTSVQLVHPSCSPLGRPPFTRVPRKCRSGSAMRPQVRPLGNRLGARSTPRHSARWGPPSEIYICGLAISTIWLGERIPVGDPQLQNHGGS